MAVSTPSLPLVLHLSLVRPGRAPRRGRRAARTRRRPDRPARRRRLPARERHRRPRRRLADLLRADPEARLAEVLQPVQTVPPDAGLEEVARTMADFDLTVVPVVDEKEQLVGVVTVDDVLEIVLPENWRRRFGVLGDD